MKSIPSILIAAAALTLAGCAQAPTAEVDDARHALDAAQTAQAQQYAPESWNAASDVKTSLDAELSAQEGKWAPTRSYVKAKALAADLKSAADKAAQDAATGKEKAKSEAQDLMTQARTAYDRSRNALSSAPRGKGTEADLASLKSDEQGIDTTLSEMQKSFDSGDYLAAKSKAQAAISAAEQIEKEIAAAKVRRRAA